MKKTIILILMVMFVGLVMFTGCKGTTDVPEIEKNRLDTPTNVRTGDEKPNSVHVYWSGNNERYKIEYSKNNFATIAGQWWTTNYITDSGYHVLEPETDYWFRVKAISEDGSDYDSEWSVVVYGKTTEAPPLKIKIYPTDDTFVNALHPDRNYGDYLYLFTGNHFTSSTSFLRSYLKFDISEIPDDAELVKATLWMATKDEFDPNLTGYVSVFSTYHSMWTEETLTYNSRPTYSTFICCKNIQFGVRAEHDWDVTSMISLEMKEFDSICAFAVNTTNIKSNGIDVENWCLFYSKEAFPGATRLEILYK